MVYNQPTPFVAGASGNFLSEGVVKVPNAQPEQLGFTGVFVPTAVNVGGTLESVFPAADNPVVSLIAYAATWAGQRPRAVRLPAGHHRHAPADDEPAVLQPGQSLKLRMAGTRSRSPATSLVSLAITHDPGQVPALI